MVNLLPDGSSFFWRCNDCGSQLEFIVKKNRYSLSQGKLDDFIKVDEYYKNREHLADNRKAFMKDY